MPTWCLCMSKDRCVRCACVNVGRTCTDCRPSRTNPRRCENIATAIVSDSSTDQSTDATVLQQDEPIRSQNSSPPLSPRGLLPNSYTTCDTVKVSDLPQYDQVACPDFLWGRIEGESFTHTISCCHAEIVNWKQNLFKVPSGKVGSAFT